MKIWQKMLLKDVLKTLFFVLMCFYLLYAMMDYSMHMRNFQSAPLPHFFLYYFYQFIKRLELLLPIAFLIALIRSLERLNKNNELLALQVAGLSFQTLIRPLFFLALFLSSLVYVNYESTLPESMNFIDAFQSRYIKKKTKDKPINVIHLKEGGKLIYQRYDTETKTYHELFYIPSPHDIYHIESLQNNIGSFVDHLEKKQNGLYELSASYPSYSFKDLHIPSKKPHYIPLENRSLSSLYKMNHLKPHSELTSKLYYKLTTPLFSLFVMLLIVPYTFYFERGKSGFSLYAYGLFGFLIYFMLVNFAKVLGISGLISPALSFPFLILGVTILSFRKILKYV